LGGGDPPVSIEELIGVRPHGTEEVPDLYQVVRSGHVPLLVWQATIPFIDPGAERQPNAPGGVRSVTAASVPGPKNWLQETHDGPPARAVMRER
jgi:hypothetical protein